MLTRESTGADAICDEFEADSRSVFVKEYMVSTVLASLGYHYPVLSTIIRSVVYNR